ncbi:MAG: tRNA pseudouridine(55) synthase TruB [Actinomycetota bacterium]|jgi:tRNA pseudouridine55 synthase
MASQSGILVIDKPLGITSHDVVSKVRKILQTKKVGHAGTLDPEASGVLVLGINRGTRLMQYFVGDDKSYQATIRLGVATKSDDAAGEVLSISPNKLNQDQIQSAIPKFTGPIMQRPSSVSAIKVNGTRAHDLVRSGVDLILPARPVTVHSFTLLSLKQENFQGNTVTDIEVSVNCSSGTYVRALARDLGSELGVGGSVLSLRRVTAGKFNLEDAISLPELTEKSKILSLGEAARRVLTCREVDSTHVADLAHGREIAILSADQQNLALLDSSGELVAIGNVSAGRFQPVNVFISPSELQDA